MRGIGKKVSHQSGKSCFSKKVSGSKLNASVQIKKGRKIPHSKKPKPKFKTHVKTVGSNLLKRTVTDSFGDGTVNDYASRKPIGSITLPKNLGAKFSKKQSFSRLQGEKSSLLRSKGNGENFDRDFKIQNLKKRRKRTRQKNKVELDEALRLQRRARYLLIKMKLELNLIEAYSGEGWKGQSREKIRPEKELQRAKKQILKCKLGIRDAICQLESLSSVGCIEETVIAPDGSIHHENIICAKCKVREASPDNDIILCDGTCNCAFHQKCLDPPLATENIPPGDQGWFCKFCECKMEILEAMNAHLGTRFSVNSSWQDIFKEEAALPEGGGALSNPEEEWPSDDSEDDDYDPEKNEYSCSISRADTEDSASDDASASSSLSWSFEEEVFSGYGRLEKRSDGSKNNSVHSINSVDSGDTTDREIIIGRRQRRAVDYKKLYDEMFGKDAPANEQVSEDEDWGPAKRKRREKESDAASTLMTLCESEKKFPNIETIEVRKKNPPDPIIKRPFFRIPPNAVEKLRQVFAENELPSRAVKENLSKQLGLDSEKVNKWFKNARYIALKTRKAERARELHSSTPRISKEARLEIVKNKTADLEASKDTSSATSVRTPKNLKKFRRRKNSKSLISPLKKKQLRRASLGSPTNSKKVNMEFSDDVSLKKQMQFLKAKSKRERKRVNFKVGGGVQAAEEEMERLCRIEGRLKNMKQVLLRLQNEKTVKLDEEAHLHEQSVIYVPVAELKEKV
ncbi:hypothetical protein L1049_001226 [Liquidambar formosana]|uniref:Pathogenesis-related homeodomain protein n=1 Tax=Liquidambar formosana TaxID=63359 RepID=A0AAP0NC26_LIQFO